MMGCTNHFNQLVEENRHHLVESKERLDHIRNHIEKSYRLLKLFLYLMKMNTVFLKKITGILLERFIQ
ncbi:hypothetical protein AAAC51_20180 [Priestia megaterium]